MQIRRFLLLILITLLNCSNQKLNRHIMTPSLKNNTFSRGQKYLFIITLNYETIQADTSQKFSILFTIFL